MDRRANPPLPRTLFALHYPFFTVFVVAAASFVAGTVVSERATAHIEHSAQDITDNLTPSVLHLGEMRGQLKQLQIAVDEFRGNPTPRNKLGVDEILRKVHVESDAYRRLPLFEEEIGHADSIRRDLDHLDESVAELVAVHGAQSDKRELSRLTLAVEQNVSRTNAAVQETIQFNTERLQKVGDEIEAERRRATVVAYGLDGVSLLLTFIAALVGRRALKQQAQLLEAHTRLVERRAEELEHFAGRVAHDLLGPLQTISLSLDLARRSGANDRTEAIHRARRGVHHAHRIIDDLLDFARAGATLDPSAKADCKEVISDVVGSLQPAASRENIDLQVEPFPPCAVAASPGILTSILVNLVQNAIKYMGQSKTRWIRVRAYPSRDRVRLEVEDSGPGLPDNLGESVFEPFVRGRHEMKPGTGLGLATVKHLAQALGGEVGVRSSPGRGSLFWVQLPRAPLEEPSYPILSQDPFKPQ
jgi:signal transduction histidine kinase